jgi:hypothetical protein
VSVSLRDLARAAAAPPPAPNPIDALERCELCGEPIAARHRHLLDLETRELLCACRACKILFEGDAAGGGHYRLVPERRLRLAGFELDDVRWADLRVPVDMVYFFRDSRAGRVVAYYPSALGATESLLELDAWEEIERANPLLATLEPDVEALLANRSGDRRDYFVVPIEDCYRLVGLIRTRWRGLSGGSEVWEEIDAFFAELAAGADEATVEREEAAWRP